MARRLNPIHPGEFLREEFMEPLGLNPHKLAMELRAPAPGVCEIVRGERGISTEMALRLARFFGTTAESWLHLQARYNLEVARDKQQDKINREVHPVAAASA
jgi:addiction module HigA family antidote